MKILYTLILASFCSLAMAQSNDVTSRYIDVSGSAEMEITPDIIVLSVRLSEYEKDRKLVKMEEIEGGFLKALNGSGLAEDKVVVSQVSSNAFNTKRHRKAFASKTYELTFSNQKELLNFTKRLKNADIDYMYISKLDHTDMQKLRLDVKKGAVKAAQVKARELVETVGSKLGHVLTISEGGNNYFSRQSNIAMASNMRFKQEDALADTTADDIGFKKIKLRFEINARFAIE